MSKARAVYVVRRLRHLPLRFGTREQGGWKKGALDEIKLMM